MVSVLRFVVLIIPLCLFRLRSYLYWSYSVPIFLVFSLLCLVCFVGIILFSFYVFERFESQKYFIFFCLLYLLLPPLFLSAFCFCSLFVCSCLPRFSLFLRVWFRAFWSIALSILYKILPSSTYLCDFWCGSRLPSSFFVCFYTVFIFCSCFALRFIVWVLLRWSWLGCLVLSSLYKCF